MAMYTVKTETQKRDKPLLERVGVSREGLGVAKKRSPKSVKMVRGPRGSYIVIPIAVSGLATPENQV